MKSGSHNLSSISEQFPSTVIFETDTNLNAFTQENPGIKSILLIFPGNNTSLIQELSNMVIPEEVEACTIRFVYFKRGFSYGTTHINTIMRQHHFNLFDVVYSQSKFLQPSLDILFVKVDGTIEHAFFARNELK